MPEKVDRAKIGAVCRICKKRIRQGYAVIIGNSVEFLGYRHPGCKYVREQKTMGKT